MIDALVLRCQEVFLGQFDVESLSGFACILQSVDAYLSALDNPKTMLRAFFVIWGTSLPSSVEKKLFVEADQRTRDNIAAVIRSGQRDGSIAQSVDPKSFAFTLLGMLRGAGAQLITSGDAIKVRVARAQYKTTVSLVLNPAFSEAPDSMGSE